MGLQEPCELIEGVADHPGQILDQDGQVFQELGDDEVDKEEDQQQQDEGGEGGGEPSGGPFLYLMIEQEVLGEPGEWVEQVGHDKAQHDRAQGGQGVPEA